LTDAVARLLRRHRQRLRLTQEELAGLAGISTRTIGEMERNRGRGPRPDTVERLATALRLSGVDREEFVRAGRELFWANRAGRREPHGASDPAVRTDPVPAQLPADVPAFAGRLRQLRELGTLARRTIAVITGPPGVGKTALAVHFAHRVTDRFPDGQIYVDLRGYHPGGRITDPVEAVRRVLDAFAVPPARIPTGVEAQLDLYRSVLAGRRVLLVLDNARDAEQARSLLPGSPSCLTIVTSRQQLSSLVVVEGAHPISLVPLTASESRGMLAHRLGEERVTADPAAVDTIVGRCAGLPLALAITAGRAALRPQDSLAALAGSLRSELEDFAGTDPVIDLRSVFSWSFEAVSAPARRLFRLLGLHPGPEVGTAAAASLAGRPPSAVEPLLRELTEANLIAEPVRDRFVLHDLLHSYAAELADTADNGAATMRLYDHYLHTAWRAATLINPGRDPIRLDKPHRAVTLDELSDGPQAVAWLTREHRALLAVVAQSAERKSHRHTWQLAWCLSDYFLHQGHFHDSVVTQRAALQALAQLGDEAGQARIHRVLARTYISRAANDIGESHLKQAVELSLAAGDQRGQAHSHSSLGWLYGLQGRHNEELDEAEAAARLFRATNFAIGEADALNSVGWSLAMLGRYDEALAPCEQALAVQQQQGNQTGEAAAWDSLGYIHSHQGDHGRAIAAYQRAVAIFEQMGDRLNVADTLISLGNAHTATGAGAGAATAAWERALGILEELGHPDAQRVREKLEKRAGTDP